MKTIPLANSSKLVLVDDDIFDTIKNSRWQLDKDGYAVNYKRTNTKGSWTKLHRLVLNLKKGEGIVDHIDNNKLNNTRDNLRLCSSQKNSFNRLGSKNKKYSLYKGVSYLPRIKKWTASLTKNGKRVYLAWFSTELEAAIAYNKAAEQYFGNFAKLNKIF